MTLNRRKDQHLYEILRIVLKDKYTRFPIINGSRNWIFDKAFGNRSVHFQYSSIRRLFKAEKPGVNENKFDSFTA